MRIRNSRPPMSILPLPPEIVMKSSRFRTRGPLINDRFFVREGSQTLLGSGSGSRTSNCSRTVRRIEREDGSNFPSVVLALPARSSRPDFLKISSVSESERELPLKKRMFYRLNIGKKKNDEVKQEQSAEKKDETKPKKAAVTEANMNATPISEKEHSGEIKGGKKSKSFHCVLNRESSIPCPTISSPKEKAKAEKLPVRAPLVKQEETEKRRRGRPKKKPRAPRGNPGFKKSIYVLD